VFCAKLKKFFWRNDHNCEPIKSCRAKLSDQLSKIQFIGAATGTSFSLCPRNHRYLSADAAILRVEEAESWRLAISGKSMGQSSAGIAKGLGVVSVLQKPFSLTKLFDAIAEALVVHK
jgi:hypothetical protein